MGRSYRTASATPLDYMYKLNAPLAERAIEFNDAQIDNSLNTTATIGGLASFNHLDKDAEDAKAITDAYTQKVDQLAQDIRKDPINWREKQDAIRTLKQEMTNDYTTGKISKLTGNFNRRKEAFDAVDKQAELWHTSGGKKGVSPEEQAAYKNHWDNSFSRTFDPNDPTKTNVYQGGNAMDHVDVRKALAEGLDKLKADKTKEWHSGPQGDWYIDKVTNETVQVTPERILSIVAGKIPELRPYLADRQALGLIHGADVAPYSRVAVPASPEEQGMLDSLKTTISKTKDPSVRAALQSKYDNALRQVSQRKQLSFNEDSYLGPILSSLTDEFGYKQTSGGNDLKNNSVGPTLFNAQQANFRQGRALQQAENHFQAQEKAKQDNFDKTLKLNQEKFGFQKETEEWKRTHGYPKAGTNTSTTSAAAKVNVTPDLPTETGISKFSTNSFADLKSMDGRTPLLTTSGLSKDIDGYKARITEIDNTLDLYSVDDVTKAKLEKERSDLVSGLGLRRDWYGMTTKAVLSGNEKAGTPLKPEEVEIYKEITEKNGIAKLQKEIAQADAEYKKIQAPAVVVGSPQKTEERAQARAAAHQRTEDLRDKLQHYKAVKKTVDERRDTFLGNLAKQYIDTDAIIPNQKESDEIKDLVFSNSQETTIYDDMGKLRSGEQLVTNPKGTGQPALSGPFSKKWNFGFEGTDNLKDYIDRYNVKMNIQKIGGTTALGKGNTTLQVTFDDPKGVLTKGKLYYIQVNDNVQREIADKYSKHKNPEVAKLGAQMADDEGNDIKRQLAKPNAHALAGETGFNSEKFTINLRTPAGNSLPLNVIPMSSGTELHVTTPSGFDFPRVDGREAGMFKNSDDFVEQVKAFKALPVAEQNRLYEQAKKQR